MLKTSLGQTLEKFRGLPGSTYVGRPSRKSEAPERLLTYIAEIASIDSRASRRTEAWWRRARLPFPGRGPVKGIGGVRARAAAV